MELLIDTTKQEQIILMLQSDDQRFLAQEKKEVFQISENLLLMLEKFLRKQKLSLKDLTKILVNPGPGGFSSTRTGVATANTLSYVLNIPLASWPSGKVKKVILPKYDKEPNISRPKS